jgi:hypothetical protein
VLHGFTDVVDGICVNVGVDGQVIDEIAKCVENVGCKAFEERHNGPGCCPLLLSFREDVGVCGLFSEADAPLVLGLDDFGESGELLRSELSGRNW